MSIKLMSLIWSTDTAVLSGSKRLLMLALADNADDSGKRCYPSIQTLSHKTGISNRQIMRLIRELETDCFLSVIRQPRKNNYYALNVEHLLINQRQPEGDKLSHVKSDNLSPKGDIDVTLRVTPMSPDPPYNRPNNIEGKRYLFELPSDINTPRMQDIIEKWVLHTKALGKSWTTVQADLLTEELCKIGEEQAYNLINFSLIRGYRNLVAPPAATNGNGNGYRKSKTAQGLEAIEQAFSEMELEGIV